MSDSGSEYLSSDDEVESLGRTDEESEGESEGGESEGGESQGGADNGAEPTSKRKKTDVGQVVEWVHGPVHEAEEGHVFGFVAGERLIIGEREREPGEEGLARLPWNPDLPMKTLSRKKVTQARFDARTFIDNATNFLATASNNTRASVDKAQEDAKKAYQPVLQRALAEDRRKKQAKKRKKAGGAKAKPGAKPVGAKAARPKAAGAKAAAEVSGAEDGGDEELCSLPWVKDGEKLRFIDAPARPAGLRPGYARNIPPEDQKDPLKVFLSLFPGEILDRIIHRTNRKGMEARKDWKDLDRTEMLAYLALHFSFWSTRMPSLDLHWSDSPFAAPIAAQTMRKNRFLAIHASLSIADRLEDLRDEDLRDSHSRKGPDGRPAKTPVDKGFKMSKAVSLFSDSWISHYTPSAHVAIDEASVAFTGRFRFKLSIKAKPVKSHVRMWALACSKRNYQLRMILSTNAGSLPRGEELGMASASVIALLDESEFAYDFSNKGITVFVDNFYSSPQLMEVLRRRGLYLMGSLRGQTGDLPKEAAKMLGKGSPLAKMPRGTTMVWATPASELFVVMDSQPVGFLTNIPHLTAADQTIVMRRCKGKREAVAVQVPVALSWYNSKMGGVDVGDRLVANLRGKERNVSWTSAVLNRLLRVTVANAFLIWREAMGLKKKDAGAGKFTLLVAEALLKAGPSPFIGPNVLPVAKALQKAAPGIKQGLLHQPLNIGSSRRCSAVLPHSGKLCHKKTWTCCSTCTTERGFLRPLCYKKGKPGEEPIGHFWPVHSAALADEGRKGTLVEEESAGPSSGKDFYEGIGLDRNGLFEFEDQGGEQGPDEEEGLQPSRSVAGDEREEEGLQPSGSFAGDEVEEEGLQPSGSVAGDEGEEEGLQPSGSFAVDEREEEGLQPSGSFAGDEVEEGLQPSGSVAGDEGEEEHSGADEEVYNGDEADDAQDDQ